MTDDLCEAEPWERLEGEPTKAYELFCFFRDYGPSRTYSAVARKYNGIEFDSGHDNLRAYGKKWNWLARAQAYDDYILKEELAVAEKLTKAYREKQILRAQEMADRYAGMMEEEDQYALSAREKRERFKLATDIASDLLQVNKKKDGEVMASVTIVFGDEVKDV
jgi:hypothetical protein